MSIAPSTPIPATSHPSQRDAYAEVALAQAYSQDRIFAADVGAFAQRVWIVVTSRYLARWSRLTDSRAHLTRDICRLLDISATKSARSRVGAALRALADAGALQYRPASGSEPALIGLVSPPDGWTDTACGRTAGDLRQRRAQAADRRADPIPSPQGGSPNVEGGGVPRYPGTRNEGLNENPLPRAHASTPSPPKRTEPSSSLQDQKQDQPPARLQAGDPPSPLLDRVLNQLPTPVAAEATAHRHRAKLDRLLNQLAEKISEDALVARIGAPMTDVRSPYAVLLTRIREALDAATAKTAAAEQAARTQAAARIENARRWATTVLPQVTSTATEAYDAITSELADDADARAAARAAYDEVVA